jgi:hypothetical protein
LGYLPHHLARSGLVYLGSLIVTLGEIQPVKRGMNIPQQPDTANVGG